MTALSNQRANPPVVFTRKRMTCAASTAFYKGGAVGIETASGANQGLIVPMSTSTTLLYVGVAAENVTSTQVDRRLNVDFGREIMAYWYVNDSAPNACATTDVGALCYATDDNVVMITGTGKSVMGRIWAVDTNKGVLVEKLTSSQISTQTGNIAASAVTAGTAYQVLRTNAGATASEWGRVVETYAAINATNDVSIQISQGKIREITACGDDKDVTIATTGAVAGDTIVIFRAALGATTGSNIVNGGAGAGTLMSMTANKAAGIIVVFDGTNWKSALQYQAA